MFSRLLFFIWANEVVVVVADDAVGEEDDAELHDARQPADEDDKGDEAVHDVDVDAAEDEGVGEGPAFSQQELNHYLKLIT
jgi:hypothetical protein